MAEGWKPVTIAEGLYSAAKKYFEENKEDLKLSGRYQELHRVRQFRYPRILERKRHRLTLS